MANVFVALRSLRSFLAWTLLALQLAALVRSLAEAAKPRPRTPDLGLPKAVPEMSKLLDNDEVLLNKVIFMRCLNFSTGV